MMFAAAVPLELIIGLIAAIITAVVSWLWIAAADTETLWEESRELRRDLNQSTAQLTARITELEAEVTALQTEKIELLRVITALEKRVGK